MPDYMDKSRVYGRSRIPHKQQGIWQGRLDVQFSGRPGEQIIFAPDRDTPSRRRTGIGCAAGRTLTLPWNIEAKIDLDYVSDRNFLQEFSIGSTSYFTCKPGVLASISAAAFSTTRHPWCANPPFISKRRANPDLLSMDVRYWENLATPTDTGAVREAAGLLLYSDSQVD